MSGQRFSAPIDFNSYDMVRARIERLASDPATAAKFIGRIWLNTTSHAVKVQTDTSTTTTLGSGSGVSKYAVTVGDAAATSFAITHSLGTLDVVCQVWLISTGVLQAPTSITKNSTNALTVVMGSAPALNNLRVVVIGS